MATVTVVDAERTLEIEATSIVSGLVNSAGHLILTRHDGTDIDMGAVSGMQLDSGSSYSKVDAFTYVGDTDPGAVPDGSVWLDTTDVAGPFASDIQKGLVELATSAETISGTDNTRAVTPAGLAAVPGNKVQILAANANTETAVPSAYPLGISQMTLTTGSGWSVNSGFGSIVTYRPETDRTVQHAFSNPGGMGAPRMWMRQYHTSNNGGGWTAWSQAQMLYALTPGALVQTTVFTSYPAGWSRMYFSTANGTGWDFAGTAGELMTFVDGSDFAKQMFMAHSSGVGTPSFWYRTANAANGWTAWQKILTDPNGWTAYTPTWSTSSGTATPTLGNATISCFYRKLGRTVEVKFEVTFGTTTNFGGGGTGDNWNFTVPVAAARSTDSIGFVELNNNSNTAVCMGRARLVNSTTFRIGIVTARVDGTAVSNSGDADAVSPFTWVTSGSIKGHFAYESAA